MILPTRKSSTALSTSVTSWGESALHSNNNPRPPSSASGPRGPHQTRNAWPAPRGSACRPGVSVSDACATAYIAGDGDGKLEDLVKVELVCHCICGGMNKTDVVIVGPSGRGCCIHLGLIAPSSVCARYDVHRVERDKGDVLRS